MCDFNDKVLCITGGPKVLYLTTVTFKSMADRKAELERKKAKLQALREEKERRRMEKAQKDVSAVRLLL